MRDRSFLRFRPPSGRGSQSPHFAKKLKCPTCGSAVGNDCIEPDGTCPSAAHPARVSDAREAGLDTRRKASKELNLEALEKVLDTACESAVWLACQFVDESMVGFRSAYLVSADPSPPLDHVQFADCLRVMDMIPDGRARLGTIAEQFPAWEPVVANWNRWTGLLRKQRIRQLFTEMVERVPSPPGVKRVMPPRARDPWRRFVQREVV